MKPNDFPVLRLEEVYNASATTLFDAWMMQAVAELWLFQSGKNEVDFIADVKEGGEFHTVEKGKKHAISHSGKYIKIDRPNSILFSLAVPDHFEGLSEIGVEIKEKGDGCHLLFTQRNVDTSKTEEPWRSMLAQIHKILRAPYVITDKSDKEDLITAIQVTAIQMAGFIMPLNDEQINHSPYKNSWTAAQLMRHIIKSINGITEAIKKNAKPANREITQKIIELKQAFLDVTRTMQSPAEIVPEQKHFFKDALISDFQVCLKQFKEAVSPADLSELAEGLPLGPVTKLELLHFVLYHTQRHLHQMKKITDTLKQAGN
jgi:uncharacterized protein YndB with AHSA1/START domain